MSDKPLTTLIAGRGFDQFQKGLKSRFGAYGLIYKLTYCKPSVDPTMILDFESLFHTGRVTVQASGLCDLEVHKIPTGHRVFHARYQLESEREFHRTYPKLTEYMRDAPGWP